jgi:hypothetical protein
MLFIFLVLGGFVYLFPFFSGLLLRVDIGVLVAILESCTTCHTYQFFIASIAGIYESKISLFEGGM